MVRSELGVSPYSGLFPQLPLSRTFPEIKAFGQGRAVDAPTGMQHA